MKKITLLTLSLLMSLLTIAQATDSPLRIGVSGVAHGHLWNLINAMNRGDFVIVGVAEENDDFRQHNNLVDRLPKEKFYASVSEMLDKEKPEVYHAFEGYSPGAKKSKVEEDFSRYHYYIAPIREETYDSDPDIYFRQDYEAIEPVPTFDEEQYWREHPLTFDEPSPSSDNPDTP